MSSLSVHQDKSVAGRDSIDESREIHDSDAEDGVLRRRPVVADYICVYRR